MTTNPKTIDETNIYSIIGNCVADNFKKIHLDSTYYPDINLILEAKLALLQAIEGVRPEQKALNEEAYSLNHDLYMKHLGYNKGISDSYKAIKELFNA